MFAQETLGCSLKETAVRGERAALAGQFVLILNSRQSKMPVGSDAWVCNTAEAVRSAVGEGIPIIASVGMNTWELVLWAVGRYRGQAVVILRMPRMGSPEALITQVAEDFGLDARLHAWVFVPLPADPRSRKAWWDARDRLAFSLAARLLPVSVRDGGRWDAWLKERQGEGVVDPQFRVPYAGGSRRVSFEQPSICSSSDQWDYLTHWTCRCYGPWPGERSADFYRDLVSSGTEYARSASRTLGRILREGRLRGSSRRIRGGSPAVAFTALAPSEAVPLMRWRKRYVRPTFEPYGIAICKMAAMDLGIRPVTYVESGSAASGDSVLTQGYGKGDWPREAEWRALGDVDLNALGDHEAQVLVPTAAEADEFKRLTRFQVKALF